jgi:agmatinase
VVFGMAWLTTLTKLSFGCVEEKKSPIAVLGVPLDHTATYRPGSRFAPLKIRDAACNIELYSLLAGLSLEDIGFKDYGDIVLQPSDVEGALRRIGLVLSKILEEHQGLLLVLGGEHLLTYSSIKTYSHSIDTVIVFDAHLDLRDEYLGSRLNHATFLRRVVEETSSRVIHIGSRAYSKGELEFAKKVGIEVYNILDVIAGKVHFDNLRRVYVSIDIDVFDPSIAPGTGNPEPYGLYLREFFPLLKSIFEEASKVYAVDIVEVNPIVDHGDVTSILAAKIAVEAAGLYISEKR